MTVVTASNVITWNAPDSDGVASASLTVDGANVSKVYGPYTAASGVNFGADYGTLTAGTHNYVITATDKAGNSSTYNGTFNVAAPINSGPTIGGVTIVTASNVMTWNAQDPDGVASASLTVDGANVSKVYGPYTASSGVNFGADYGTLAAGTHNYVITATDKAGHSSTSIGSFDRAAPINSGPTIGGVMIVTASNLITWNASDSDGVASSSLKVDGVKVSKIYGPFTASSGVNFSGVYGTLPAGSHTYEITATDKAGHSFNFVRNVQRACHVEIPRGLQVSGLEYRVGSFGAEDVDLRQGGMALRRHGFDVHG